MSESDAQLQATLASAEEVVADARPSPWSLVGFAIGSSLGGLLCALRVGATSAVGYALFGIGGALVGVVGAFVSAKSRARRTQTDRYFTEFALARGWSYHRAGGAPSQATPMLRAGDGQTAGPGFEFAIDGLACRLYQHIKRVGSGKNETFTSYVVLVTQVDLPGIRRLSVHPHEGAAARILDGSLLSDSKVVTLESEEFERAFLLEVGSEVDETQVRRLFDPVFITQLLDFAAADCYLGDYCEVEGRQLVLASEGTITLEDGAYLDATVKAVAPVLAHLLAFANQIAPA